jgi:DNA-binding CsgD family transcriptional regulator
MSELKYKVDIIPSYEWEKEAEALNISHRELEVFALVTEGYNNKEIAKILKIEYQSVKNHLHHLHQKLEVKNSTQALIIALKLNLIKVRGKLGDYKDIPPVDITAEGLIKSLRNLISGKSWSAGFSEKDKRTMRVFLKEHGIDPDDWK